MLKRVVIARTELHLVEDLIPAMQGHQPRTPLTFSWDQLGAEFENTN